MRLQDVRTQAPYAPGTSLLRTYLGLPYPGSLRTWGFLTQASYVTKASLPRLRTYLGPPYPGPLPCRWLQSAETLTVIAHRAPRAACRASALAVEISSRQIHVACARTGEVCLNDSLGFG